MASRVKIRTQSVRKLEASDYRSQIAIFSALIFLGWMVLEITLKR